MQPTELTAAIRGVTYRIVRHGVEGGHRYGFDPALPITCTFTQFDYSRMLLRQSFLEPSSGKTRLASEAIMIAPALCRENKSHSRKWGGKRQFRRAIGRAKEIVSAVRAIP